MIQQNYDKKRMGEGDIKLDKDRLMQAMKDEKKRKKGDDDDRDGSGKKSKSSWEGGGSHDVTEEELGMFRMFLYQRRRRSKSIRRGVSDAQANNRGPYGRLCRRRGLNLLHCMLSFCFYVA